MLHRLLNLGSTGSAGSAAASGQDQSTPPPTVSTLESVQEDIHTRNLLFPDTQLLLQQRNDQVFPFSTAAPALGAAPSHAFDYNEDFDLNVRDVRLLIMQDTLGSTNTTLLYDSHPCAATPASPASEAPSTPLEPRATPPSPRKSSLGGASARPLIIQSGSPQQRFGAFDRRGSLHSRSQSSAETELQRASREYREELAIFSSCIFGNSELMAYKGTSTKVHIVPNDTRPVENNPSIVGDGRGSMGRSSARSSKLSQSFSPQSFSAVQASSSHAGSFLRSGDRKKVLITRLFPVNMTNEDADQVLQQGRFSDDNTSFPFPNTTDDSASQTKKPQPKQRRTPMYAVALVVQLPPASPKASSAAPRSATRDTASFNDRDFFACSYSYTKASPWGPTLSAPHGDGAESCYSLDVEDRIGLLTQHWDVIMRTLTHLQSTAAATIHVLLKRVDAASLALPQLSFARGNAARATSTAERRSSEVAWAKPSKGTTKVVTLWPNCLSEDVAIAKEVESARLRIVRGLCAARVVTGQGRWGIWRDEAIWSSKRIASLGQGPFFCSLITGFLATHTDWLQALAPMSYRKQMHTRRQRRNEEDLSLYSRTIIVSDDKMAARRIIFLLTAFLPTSQQVPTNRTHRLPTSASFGVFTPSPPSLVAPLLREESLRRRINRGTSTRRASHSRAASQNARTSTHANQMSQITSERGHERRPSDAASIRAATNLALAGNDATIRKSSAATTTTEAALPHFSNVRAVDSRRKPRPESSGSMAADDLKRSLQRVEAGSQARTSPSDSTLHSMKWGALIGGFWNQRRGWSTDSKATAQQASAKSSMAPSPGRGDKGLGLLRDGPGSEANGASSSRSVVDAPSAQDSGAARALSSQELSPFFQSDQTPDPSGAFHSPVKTSINAEDGVIDVDVPFPDYMMLESALSSPSSSGYLSTPGIPSGPETFEQSGRFVADGDLPQNTAGWLDCYHPDFTLQAVPPQEDLVRQVKESLRSEPTPSSVCTPGNVASQRWADIGSALIADMVSGTVTRISYRRLVKTNITAQASSQGSSSMPDFYSGTPSGTSVLRNDASLEEEWIEDTVTAPDEAIVEAVDKIITLNTDASKAGSAPSSRVQSEASQAWDADRTTGVTNVFSEATPVATSSGDIPRIQCKTAVLSALEETIRDVIDRREELGSRLSERPISSPHRYNILRQAIRDWLAAAEANE